MGRPARNLQGGGVGCALDRHGTYAQRRTQWERNHLVCSCSRWRPSTTGGSYVSNYLPRGVLLFFGRGIADRTVRHGRRRFAWLHQAKSQGDHGLRARRARLARSAGRHGAHGAAPGESRVREARVCNRDASHRDPAARRIGEWSVGIPGSRLSEAAGRAIRPGRILAECGAGDDARRRRSAHRPGRLPN